MKYIQCDRCGNIARVQITQLERVQFYDYDANVVNSYSIESGVSVEARPREEPIRTSAPATMPTVLKLCFGCYGSEKGGSVGGKDEPMPKQ
jgi:hypothetical protein